MHNGTLNCLPEGRKCQDAEKKGEARATSREAPGQDPRAQSPESGGWGGAGT